MLGRHACALAARLIACEGHEVVLAVDGKLALEAFAEREWDIVLMDVQMPVMDGLQATEAIRALEKTTGRPRTPIVALTASVLPEEIGSCLASGMDEVLAKPVTKAALLDVLARRVAARATSPSAGP
ncbi:MAG: response regulator [Proteobacteria bacterium]|nr:response regulator [Pseudomonadota bacterium]